MQHNWLQPIRFLPFLAGCLAAVVAGLVLARQPEAFGLDTQALSKGDVVAFPFQISPSADGIAVIDPQAQTICLYQYQYSRQAMHGQLALLAARSYRHDRQLEQFNTTPALDEVKAWSHRAAQLKGTGASVGDGVPEAPKAGGENGTSSEGVPGPVDLGPPARR